MSTEFRTLLLLRHAKSGYPSGVVDHERPLAERGVREAGLAGEYLRAHAPVIEAVLCSTATRTRQTLQRARIDAPVCYLDGLYDATPGEVIDQINRVPELFDHPVRTLLVIGHEPAMSRVSLGLADLDGSNHAAAEALSSKYPTSAIAELRTAHTWERLTLGGAALITFHVPR
ncbi:SixA phosphatase family protein [Mycobacterium sp. WMMD1722]|uniref:SixA phosphatase family protein n=1 Tax=Mycobacterium sp. WMMD1722 TaxID=3404117 RepID=UPI003BF61876